VADIIANADKGSYLIAWNRPFFSEAMNDRVSHALYQDGDGFLLSSEVLDTLQQLLTERFRLEVEEDASGMNALLFEFVDTDKSETIELPGESPFNIINILRLYGSMCTVCKSYFNRLTRVAGISVAGTLIDFG
jgi:hypothetical protein